MSPLSPWPPLPRWSCRSSCPGAWRRPPFPVAPNVWKRVPPSASVRIFDPAWPRQTFEQEARPTGRLKARNPRGQREGKREPRAVWGISFDSSFSFPSERRKTVHGKSDPNHELEKPGARKNGRRRSGASESRQANLLARDPASGAKTNDQTHHEYDGYHQE